MTLRNDERCNQLRDIFLPNMLNFAANCVKAEHTATVSASQK